MMRCLTICLLMFMPVMVSHANIADDYYQGVNYLQTPNVSLKSFTSMQSLRKIKEAGANTVALVVFLQQDSATSKYLKPSSAVTEHQLIQAIADAHDIGLKVILKPQILVTNSWAGEINLPDTDDWQQWYNSYQKFIVRYAQIAQTYNVEILVLGTELRYAARQPQFQQLITAVRKKYRGEISYAAHGIAGLERFPFWDLLDSASVTLYPSLGKDWDENKAGKVISEKVKALQLVASKIGKPFWIAEIGISSAQGSHQHPWLVTNNQQGVPDAELQAKVLGLWLKNLQQRWVSGVMVWCWFSDHDMGGLTDTGFTIQNKAAETVVSCYWKKQC
ncbi:MAG: hypothetical protein GXP13_04420 [Gammaproteobacteria bacterium]|nr:hypothetical protein [Gammaproteobacteria bacterium]